MILFSNYHMKKPGLHGLKPHNFGHEALKFSGPGSLESVELTKKLGRDLLLEGAG